MAYSEETQTHLTRADSAASDIVEMMQSRIIDPINGDELNLNEELFNGESFATALEEARDNLNTLIELEFEVAREIEQELAENAAEE